MNRVYISLIFFLMLCSVALFGQNKEADSKVNEIESFKKYEIVKIERPEDLELLSDSTTEVLGVTNYTRRGKKNGLLGKVTEYSRSINGLTNRTYYFNAKGKLFVIIDDIQRSGNSTAKLTYYFAGGELTQAIDGNNEDLTGRIDKQKLFNWIARMFTIDIIN